MRVLFVCTDRYPTAGACTNLLKKVFFDGKLAETNEIHLATYKYELNENDIETINGVVVHRLLSTSFIPIGELKRKPIRFQLLCKGLLQKIKRKCVSRFIKSHELDYARIIEYKRYLSRLCKENCFDVIVGVAGSYELAMAAEAVANNNGIRYILYQVDPLTDNIMYNPRFEKQREIKEKELYLGSDKVFTTGLIYSRMKNQLNSEQMRKVEIMEFPGVSVDQTPLSDKRNDEEVINCVFAGRVYKGIRNPSFTIELFRNLPEKCLLKLVGVSDKELNESYEITDIPQNVECCGQVSVDEADRAIKRADILVNIGNAMPNQVPSKLFSYISTGRPILNICANSKCPSKKYLEHYPYSLSITEETPCSEKAVKKAWKFIMENSGKMGDLDSIEEIYERCTPGYAANQMNTAFIQICKR